MNQKLLGFTFLTLALESHFFCTKATSDEEINKPGRAEFSYGEIYACYVDSRSRSLINGLPAKPNVTVGAKFEEFGNQDWSKEEKIRLIFLCICSMQLDGEGYESMKEFCGKDSIYIAETLSKLDYIKIQKYLYLSNEQIEYIKEFLMYLM